MNLKVSLKVSPMTTKVSPNPIFWAIFTIFIKNQQKKTSKKGENWPKNDKKNMKFREK